MAPGEFSACVWLRGRLAPRAEVLLGVVCGDFFQPAALTTPADGVRVFMRGEAQPHGRELDLVDMFGTLHPGEAFVLHVGNETDEVQHVAIRVDGVAVNIAGDVGTLDVAGAPTQADPLVTQMLERLRALAEQLAEEHARDITAACAIVERFAMKGTP